MSLLSPGYISHVCYIVFPSFVVSSLRVLTMSLPIISVAGNGLLSDGHRFQIKGKKYHINNCAVDTKLICLQQVSLMLKGPLVQLQSMFWPIQEPASAQSMGL